MLYTDKVYKVHYKYCIVRKFGGEHVVNEVRGSTLAIILYCTRFQNPRFLRKISIDF